ncbi:MAG: hypothetical protein KJ905_00795 [Nanoarchaeota archaeon]|nr:hypothetical protein [Nanoarchaeota archaeon]MBU1501296.1 hypothetical protein [Nanoarchaeota archaeon]
MEKQMNTKKLLVSFVMLVSVLFLVATVSAQLAGSVVVKVNDVNVDTNPAVVAGNTLPVRVEFDSLENTKDVTVYVEIEGDRKNVEAETAFFDVEEGRTYVKTLALEIPYDLKSKLSGFYGLTVKISGVDFETEQSYDLRVQRESYNVDVVSVVVPQTIKAGELFPVDVVLKNVGYNDLEDLFVSAKISDLGVSRTSFFGDIVAIECDKDLDSTSNYGVDVSRKCNEDEEDTLSGRLFLQLPQDAKEGMYALEVKVGNEDVVSSKTIQVPVENQFSDGNFIVSGNQLLIVNPSNQLAVYRLIPQSTGDVTVSVSENIVSVPAGSSRTVAVDTTSRTSGIQEYAVNVFSSDGKLVDTVMLSKDFSGSAVTSPIVVLTIVLAIIFIVLLVVLVVLIGKKPQKTEEFGESYY